MRLATIGIAALVPLMLGTSPAMARSGHYRMMASGGMLPVAVLGTTLLGEQLSFRSWIGIRSSQMARS